MTAQNQVSEKIVANIIGVIGHCNAGHQEEETL